MLTRVKKHKVRYFCSQNWKKFLQESTLHGLRFIGDDSITIWERLFFLLAFVGALISTANLIDYTYSRWSLTPIIIATNPYPTYIDDIPFPAITLCNMNQLSRSRVSKYSKESFEGALMNIACFDDVDREQFEIPPHYQNNLSITDFLFTHSQPCSDMLVNCRFNSLQYDCGSLFREHLTDEGLCCVFNLVDPQFRYKVAHHKVMKDYIIEDETEAVDWNPEFGYRNNLPKKYYPRQSNGIGLSMGLSIILNAQVDDYYCSSTNGPGFKLDLHNPIEAPRVKDNGLTISPGQDTRFRLAARSSSALPITRGISRSVRNCLFNDESKLIFYKYYTLKSCENECQAIYIHRVCRCIPFYLPLLYPNATVCGAPNNFCVEKAHRTWLRASNLTCRANCLKGCFDLTYSVTPFSAPLIQDDFRIHQAHNLRNFSKEYIRKNIAIVNIFYQDSVFYGDVRNVYVGFNEFLSNIGGILGLFLGFSFISLAEVFYFAIMRPISLWIRSHNQRLNQGREIAIPEENLNTTVWRRKEIYPYNPKNMQNGWLTYRHYKKDESQEQSKKMTHRKQLQKLQNLKQRNMI